MKMPFFLFSFCGWYVDWIHDHRIHRHGGMTLCDTLFWPLDLLTHEFSPGSVSWPLSEDGAMLRHFPRAGRCSLLSRLSHFLPEFAFYLTIHPHRFGFYVNTEDPRMSSLDHHWLQNQGTSHQDGHRAPLPISGFTAVYSWDYSRSVVVLPSWVLSCIF